LTHTPHDKAEVFFNTKEMETYLPYVKVMRDFLSQYDDEKQTDNMQFEDCGDQPGDYKNRGDLESDMGVRKACRFSKTLLGPCSGLEDPDYGFKQGKPCLIVKLNRIVNFRPKKEEDAGKIGEIKYYGIGEGFPLQYYPYYGKRLHPHYLQPLVALQFTNLTMNTELRIECKVFGENIYYNEKDRYQGRFDIKIQVNS
ncbi:hypothetical protein GOODEAATRI_031883, partial [Goodea atripinnis]